jgi:hypothetical protein
MQINTFFNLKHIKVYGGLAYLTLSDFIPILTIRWAQRVIEHMHMTQDGDHLWSSSVLKPPCLEVYSGRLYDYRNVALNPVYFTQNRLLILEFSRVLSPFSRVMRRSLVSFRTLKREREKRSSTNGDFREGTRIFLKREHPLVHFSCIQNAPLPSGPAPAKPQLERDPPLVEAPVRSVLSTRDEL